MAYQIKKIAGVQCVFVKIPIANNIFVQAFVKVGSACEDPHNSGISHFLEHILCQGSAKWNSQSEFDDFRVDNGIVSNGRTSLRMTHYYFEHHRDKHTLGLELLGDFISNPAMREDAIEKEKGVIYHELQKSRSNNEKKFFYLMIESLYKGKIIPPIGRESSIYAMSKQQLLDRKNMRYTKDNLLVVISGGYEKQEEFEQMIAEKFVSLPEHCSGDYRRVPKELNQKTEFIFDLGLKQSQIALYMPIPYETDQHREILEILCTIVRQKLYQYLRYELGITYDIQMTYTGDGLHIDGGFIKEKEQEGIELIHQVLDDFSKEDFKVNLERVKKITIKRLFPNISNPKLINDLLGGHWLSGSELLNITEMKQKIEAVTLEQIKAQCQFLSRENRWLFIAH